MRNQNWGTLCSTQAIIARSELYNSIRHFFKAKKVLEVETPVLSTATGTDPYIDSFEVFNPQDKDKNNNKYYLQTSPEFAMKRLLCSGIGSIFQICKSFRAEQIGNYHNLEFTMLEWYRVGFKLEDLMGEMAELLNFLIGSAEPNNNNTIIKITYKNLFLQYLNFDPHLTGVNFLKNKITELLPNQFDHLINQPDFDSRYNQDDLLMILMSNYIEKKLPKDKFIFIYNFPASQSALAKIDNSGDYPVAKRFEVYYNNIELANGFYELSDHKEQLYRFNQDLSKRRSLNLPMVTKDENLLQALEYGLPDCSGVALGLDRLLMLKLGYNNIEDVLTFR
ncbi:MAG: EF-P lysine aminoacylase GenX [Gammaproteobacteria bacterium]|nr:EF-P lysine aminoacylase GenX [Gammaproteobacteria bacterium]